MKVLDTYSFRDEAPVECIVIWLDDAKEPAELGTFHLSKSTFPFGNSSVMRLA